MKARIRGGAGPRARRWMVAVVVTLSFSAIGMMALAAHAVLHETDLSATSAGPLAIVSPTLQPTVPPPPVRVVPVSGPPRARPALLVPAPPPPPAAATPSPAAATPTIQPDVGTPPAVTDTPSPAATGISGPTPTVGPTLSPTPLPPPPTAVGPLREENAVEVPDDGPPGPLSGVPTDPARLTLRPLAVTVDNYSPSARPQTGLGRASLIYETVAEYGITRFMAVFLEKEALVVGPVRSTRVYYNEWADSLNAIIVHAGGNSDALPQLGLLPGIQDINEIGAEMFRWQYSGGPPFFWRTSDRLMPYNLFTNVPAVRAQVARHRFPIHGHYPVDLPHKTNAPLDQRPSSGWLTIAFSSYPYAVQYRYNSGSNRYKRFMGGLPHVDAADGRQLAPRNIVVIYCKVRPDLQSTTIGSVVVATTGTGDALLFQDGLVRHGLWRRDGVGGRLLLTDAQGQPWSFNPGQTWIEAVPKGNPVAWSPWSGR